MKRLLLLLAFVGFAFAKEYSVNSIESLQNAFFDIQTINEKAIINIENGEYIVTSPLVYIDDKKQEIFINGNDSLFKAKNNQIFIIDNNLSIVTINNITFKNGESNDSGGAILSNGNLIINYSEFKNNKSISGGAVSANNISINNSIFKDNEALYGGAIDALDNATINSSTFKLNESKYGGAIIAKQLNIFNSSFSHNSAEYGGAVSVDENFSITDSVFEQNSAVYGGAVVASFNSFISASRFKNNFATYGGAIMLENGLDVENTLFLRNRASYGGAIVADGCGINNSTFLDNFASKYASAIYGNGKIENSIFLDKFDEIILSGDLTIDSSSIDESKIFKDTYNLSLSNIYNFNYDELAFIDNFRLSSSSQAIGKANSNAAFYDIDKNKRDGTADIGASEFIVDSKRVENKTVKLFVDHLHNGWNLVALGEDTLLNSDIFENIKSLWTYRNGQWYAYSKDSDILKFLNENSINIAEKAYSYEGVWIYK